MSKCACSICAITADLPTFNTSLVDESPAVTCTLGGMQLTFVDKAELAPHVWLFTFAPEAAVEYVPGQYARFTFPFPITDPRGTQYRTFSLISHPSEPTIRFITRLDEPRSTYKQALISLKPGDTMHMDEPHGDAILPRLPSVPLVFVAQGIALASYVSMLHECARSDLSHLITLLWARRASDDPLATLLPPNLPKVKRRDAHYPAVITAQHIMSATAPDSLIYLSGGQRLVETLGTGLETHGIPRERIIYDYYEGYLEL